MVTGYLRLAALKKPHADLEVGLGAALRRVLLAEEGEQAAALLVALSGGCLGQVERLRHVGLGAGGSLTGENHEGQLTLGDGVAVLGDRVAQHLGCRGVVLGDASRVVAVVQLVGQPERSVSRHAFVQLLLLSRG